MAAVTICSDFGSPKKSDKEGLIFAAVAWTLSIHKIIFTDSFTAAFTCEQTGHFPDGRVQSLCENESCLSHDFSLCDPMDCSPSGSSVHGILQERVLEWVAISLFSVDSILMTDNISCKNI